MTIGVHKFQELRQKQELLETMTDSTTILLTLDSLSGFDRLLKGSLGLVESPRLDTAFEKLVELTVR